MKSSNVRARCQVTLSNNRAEYLKLGLQILVFSTLNCVYYAIAQHFTCYNVHDTSKEFLIPQQLRKYIFLAYKK